ncbi:MAG: hypothetical protein Terrestrivirus1_192 [Terrestrivirus sp.]|jgi:hypothetical protein|uniref:Uncharacterized protein n=1 Tax=Terrestrivirus sp. TaxID=2487775 RepID=A0A3G4ZKF3_9VIRU|nr:MAG: hypothetical protein Terrestrivirus1_192 [Terrestrivirus sp.]
MGAAQSSTNTENDTSSLDQRVKNAKSLDVGPGEHTLSHDTLAYKKIKCGDNGERCIATLLLPVGTTVIRPTITTCGSDDCTTQISDKMRVDQAMPVSIECKTNTVEKLNNCKSCHTNSFVYAVGKLARETLDKSQTEQCTKGIHVFGTKNEALDYEI